MMISNTSEQREVRLAVVSDIHLGSKRNPTSFIINNLNRHLVTDAFLASIDILFLAGDVFDEEQYTYTAEYAQIGQWIARLIRKCHQFKVAIRVLEGTRSHDRGQSVLFVTLAEAMGKIGKGVDLKYVNELSLEHIEKFNLTVLYVPDDLNSGNTQATLDQVKQLLAQHGLLSVDIAVMHGNFPHQLPGGIDHIPMHDYDEYSKLVRWLIFIGHIHICSVLGKVHAQGSFDRLSHNEEEPKGFFRAVLRKDSYKVTFIENTSAAVYKTITCDADSVAENILKIDETVKPVPDGANLRIEANQGNPILDNLGLIKERWPMHNWASVVRGKDKKKAEPLLDHKLVYVPVTLDRQTLHPTLMGRLVQKNYEPAVLERCDEMLSQFTGGTNGNSGRPPF
jgi:DNA repair exonuclease SbcCD nuclease subunit